MKKWKSKERLSKLEEKSHNEGQWIYRLRERIESLEKASLVDTCTGRCLPVEEMARKITELETQNQARLGEIESLREWVAKIDQGLGEEKLADRVGRLEKKAENFAVISDERAQVLSNLTTRIQQIESRVVVPHKEAAPLLKRFQAVEDHLAWLLNCHDMTYEHDNMELKEGKDEEAT